MRQFFAVCLVLVVCCGAIAQQTPPQVDVAELTKGLSAADAEQRATAASRLGRLGERAAVAVPALIKALDDDANIVCCRAARTLGAVGPAAAEAVPALTAKLEADDAHLRAYAAFALGRIGDAAEPAVPKLVALITDEDVIVRRAAVGAVTRIKPGPEVVGPLIIHVLEQSDPGVVVPALQVLAEQGAAVVPQLIKALENDRACYWACLILAEIGPDAAEAAEPLTALFDHEEPEVRMEAVMALAAIGPRAEAAVPKLAALVAADEAGAVKYASLFALGSIGKKRGAIEAIDGALAGDDPMVRLLGAWALAQVDVDDHASIERASKVFVEALQAADPQLVAAAAQAISDSNRDNQVFAEALVEALENAPPEAAEELIEALAGQGAVAAPRIASRLTNEKLRMLAARVLLRMGPDAVAAVPQLVESLDTDDPKFKAEVQFVLGTIGPEAAAAVPTLVASLSDENLEVRRSAIFALGRMGPAAAEAAPALRKFGRADDQFHRLGAVWALVQIETGNTELRRRAIPLFVRALGDDRFEIRRIEVARVLGLIGPLAKPAVPALQKALQDPSPRVRRAAEEALKRIQQ